MRTMKTAFRMWLAAFAVMLAAAPTLAQQPKVLKVTMHADVRTLDPFWTTQTIAGIHGLMIYDTLCSSDAELKPQPQMVDTWTVTDDRKVYTFNLRDGLTFHDGSKVTSGRGRVDEPLGQARRRRQAALDCSASLDAKDDKTFVWTLKEPYGLLIDTLAKTGRAFPSSCASRKRWSTRSSRSRKCRLGPVHLQA